MLKLQGSHISGYPILPPYFYTMKGSCFPQDTNNRACLGILFSSMLDMWPSHLKRLSVIISSTNSFIPKFLSSCDVMRSLRCLTFVVPKIPLRQRLWNTTIFGRP